MLHTGQCDYQAAHPIPWNNRCGLRHVKSSPPHANFLILKFLGCLRVICKPRSRGIWYYLEIGPIDTSITIRGIIKWLSLDMNSDIQMYPLTSELVMTITDRTWKIAAQVIGPPPTQSGALCLGRPPRVVSGTCLDCPELVILTCSLTGLGSSLSLLIPRWLYLVISIPFDSRWNTLVRYSGRNHAGLN